MFEELTGRAPKKTPKAAAPVAVPTTFSLREAAAVAAVQGLVTFHGPALSDEKVVSKARMIADLLVAELAANNVDLG